MTNPIKKQRNEQKGFRSKTVLEQRQRSRHAINQSIRVLNWARNAAATAYLSIHVRNLRSHPRERPDAETGRRCIEWYERLLPLTDTCNAAISPASHIVLLCPHSSRRLTRVDSSATWWSTFRRFVLFVCLFVFFREEPIAHETATM